MSATRSEFEGWQGWPQTSPDGLGQVFTAPDRHAQVIRTNAGLYDVQANRGMLEVPNDCTAFFALDSRGWRTLANGPDGLAFELPGGGLSVAPNGAMVKVHADGPDAGPIVIENGSRAIMLAKDGTAAVETDRLAGTFRFRTGHGLSLSDFMGGDDIWHDWTRVRPLRFQVRQDTGIEVGEENAQLWKEPGRPCVGLGRGAQVICHGPGPVRITIQAGEQPCWVPTPDGTYAEIPPRATATHDLPMVGGLSTHRRMDELRQAAKEQADPTAAAIQEMARRHKVTIRKPVGTFPPVEAAPAKRTSGLAKAIWSLIPRQKGNVREL